METKLSPSQWQLASVWERTEPCRGGGTGNSHFWLMKCGCSVLFFPSFLCFPLHPLLGQALPFSVASGWDLTPVDLRRRRKWLFVFLLLSNEQTTNPVRQVSFRTFRSVLRNHDLLNFPAAAGDRREFYAKPTPSIRQLRLQQKKIEFEMSLVQLVQSCEVSGYLGWEEIYFKLWRRGGGVLLPHRRLQNSWKFRR